MNRDQRSAIDHQRPAARASWRILLVVAFTGLALLMAARSVADASPEAIIATFDVAGETFRVRIENTTTIEQVRALERGESTATIPNGRLLAGSDGNEPWSWHLDPFDIEMAEVTIELCDGTPSLVEADLDYWIGTVGRFCPWSAQLVSVEDGKEPVGVCIDPIGTFNPTQYGGGCINYELGKDEVLLVGRALLDFTWLTYGRSVEARVNGQTCGETTIPGADGTFTLTIKGASLQAGCATAGQRVEFYIYDVQAAETLTWPSEPSSGPTFMSLTAVKNSAWYWFERVSNPRPAVGTMVEAYIGNTICGETMIGGEDDAKGYFIPEGIRGFSRLIVQSASQHADCAQNASLVEFRVNGLRAETAVFWQPGVRRLDLMVQGDASCDFLVDSRDALLALQVEARLIASVPCHGDADRDRDIDVFDARHILEFSAHITNALPL